MSAWAGSALERLAPEPLLCTAGVGLAFFTVGFCTGTAATLFTAVSWAGTTSSYLTAGCCTGAILGFGRITAAYLNCTSPPTAEAGPAMEKGLLPGPLLGAPGVGPGSVRLSFFNAGFCTVAAVLRDFLVVKVKCRCRQWNRILLGLHLARERIGRIHFEEATPGPPPRATPEHGRSGDAGLLFAGVVGAGNLCMEVVRACVAAFGVCSVLRRLAPLAPRLLQFGPDIPCSARF